MSVYAVIRSASAIVLSPLLGRFIDRSNRLNVVRVSIVGQRIAVAVSCVIMYLMVTVRMNGRVKDTCLALAILLACVEKLCSVLNLVAVERDWVVVIADGHESQLQIINARMRRIDLFCKLVGPLVISLIDGASTKIAILITLGMSIVSVFVEYFCIAHVYVLVPNLCRFHTDPNVSTHCSPSFFNRIRTLLSSLPNSLLIPLKFYINHPAFLPSFSLSLLYLTVLSFSAQMVTYLLTIPGWTSSIVGAARTVSTIFELSATWITPRVMKHTGPIRSGIWFLNWQMIWLAAGIGAFWGAKGPEGGGRDGTGFVNGKQATASAGALVGGVILSRVGLWGFDLSAQVIIQEEVQSTHRGAFSTIEASLQSVSELLSYALTIGWARPEQFQWPVLISAAAVYVAGGIYAVFVRKRRGHLVHWEKVNCAGRMH